MKKARWMIGICIVLAVLVAAIAAVSVLAQPAKEQESESTSSSAEAQEASAAANESPAIGYGIPYTEQEIPDGEVFSDALLEAMEQAGEEELLRIYLPFVKITFSPYQYNDLFDGVFLTPAEVEEVAIRTAFAEEDVDRYLEIAVLQGDFDWEVKALNHLGYAGMPTTNEQIDEYFLIRDLIVDAKEALVNAWIRRLTTETRLEGTDGTLGELLVGRNTYYYGTTALCTEMTVAELQALAKVDWAQEILLYYEDGLGSSEHNYRADVGLEDWQSALDAYQEIAAYDPAWKEQLAELEKNRPQEPGGFEPEPSTSSWTTILSAWEATVSNPDAETCIINGKLAEAMTQANENELLDVWVWAIDPDHFSQSIENDSYAVETFLAYRIGDSTLSALLDGREINSLGIAMIHTQMTVSELNLLAESGVLQPTVIGSIGLYSEP